MREEIRSIIRIAAIIVVLILPMKITPLGTTNWQAAEASSPEDFSFAAVGDWGCSSGTNAMASKLNSKNVGMIVGLGDYSYTTTMTCWHDVLANYTAVHDALHLHNSVAFGNHENATCPDCSTSEHLNATAMEEYLNHWGQASPNNPFFSFDHNRVHFLILNTNGGYYVGSNQHTFAVNDLSDARSRELNGEIDWIIVAMHHPMYTSNISGGCTTNCNLVAFRNIYQPIFDQYHADLVLAGHVHGYERSKPMTATATTSHPDTFDYINPSGQIYLTVGTGGRSEGTYVGQAAWSIRQDDKHFGFFQANVTRSTLSGAFVDTSGTILDSFNIIKTDEQLAPQPPAALPPSPPPSPSPNPPSYTFSGSNYTQALSNNNLKLSTFSVATWFNFNQDFTAYTAKAVMVNKGGFGSEATGQNMNYGIWVDFGNNANKIQAGFEQTKGADKFVSSTQSYKDGKWHYAVLTYDKSNLRLYIDGVQVSSLPATTNPDTGNQPLRLGANSWAVDRYYTGSLDEVRVWNRALTSSEVINAFNGSPNTNGQVAYFPG